MQTTLPEALIATSDGRRAEAILRSCVHCGFCNATCPTYQILGDELDGPRGRIYLIKEMLEQERVDPVAVKRLDRCLTCRACETTCPSGVAYGELLEIGRGYQHGYHRRSLRQRLLRRWLLKVVPDPRLFARWAALGRLARPLLGRRLRAQLPRRANARTAVEVADPEQTVILLDGCVQRLTTPGVNDTVAKLLAARRVRVLRVPAEVCCGGLALHLGEDRQARRTMAGNLDALAPHLDAATAVVSTASGCGVTLKDYPRLLADDPERADLAARFAAKAVDVGELLDSLGGTWTKALPVERVALHVPCTLEHGQRRGSHPGVVLRRAGYTLVPVRDPHLCCGSAGTYSLLQPALSETLGRNKVAALTAREPEVIATANVGCQLHLAGLADVPVRHWVELLAPAAGSRSS